MKSTRTLLIILTLLGAFSQTNADKPNIIFIMSDDHCSQAVGAYGGRLASLNPTPTLDRLAREGALLTNVFVTNSICTPSRATILTGQYAHTCGAYDLGSRVKPQNQFLAIEMKKAGYETAMIGKWHLKEEPAAFDYYCVLPGQGKYDNPQFRIRGEQKWPKNLISFEGQHSTDTITDLTLDWLENTRDGSKPFFLMHHYKAPHDYFENAKRYDQYLADTEIPEPENMWDRGEKFGSMATRGEDDELVPHIGTSIGRRNPRRSYARDFKVDKNLNDEEAKRAAYNIYLKKYLRCVKGIDDNLARLFQYLESENLMDNTLIIYTGDQGFMLGEHDYQDKRWMYEESQRMPFLVRYPKSIPAGTRSDAIVENVDFAAMMLDFAGAKTPDYMQGKSFRQIVETGKEPDGWKQAAYYRYWMHMAHHDNPGHLGIRTKTHKLIYYYGAGYGKNAYRTPPGWELYDIVNDPMENVNLVDHPDYTAIVADLKNQLAQLRNQIGDSGDDYPEIEKVVQEFWDYDDIDRKRAIELSHQFRERREAELKNRDHPKPKKNPTVKKKTAGFAPDQNKTTPPDGAIVLFDSENPKFLAMDGNEINWPIDEGALVSTTKPGNVNHLVSQLHFRDADIHIEFMTNKGGAGNSGIYIHGNYELQIHNIQKNKKKLSFHDVGAIYGFSVPLVQAGREAGEWQIYDIRYIAPRRDAKGEIVEEGELSAWLNGQQVQDGATFGEPRSVYHPYRHGTTPYLQEIWKRQKKTSVGPVFLQDHNNQVRFRNIWIKPLDNLAFMYEPETAANN